MVQHQEDAEILKSKIKYNICGDIVDFTQEFSKKNGATGRAAT